MAGWTSDDAGADQSAVIGLLSDPETHGGAEVERVDTHISHLFLAGRRVYKLKRAVKLAFLDFSTPELRRKACERELEVNAIAADLYLGVVPIVRRDGGLYLGGDGDPVDWVVEMKRFDRSTEFDRLAEAGRLTPERAEALADVVAEMHASAPLTPDHGGSQAVLATIRQIAESIRATPQAERLAGPLARWQAMAERMCAKRARQLDARQRHGFVRRCHGDLHLGNICLVDGRPTPFDAMEFNEALASIDMLYDIAFTVMDLVERGLKHEANAFLSRYLSARRDYSGLSLLPVFVSMRAAVRCMVAASLSTPEPGAPSASDRIGFALASLADRTAPRLIAVGGLSGSGKSTFARRIAPEIGAGAGAVVLRSDVARKRLWGVAPEDPLPDAAYSAETSARVYTRLSRDAGRAVRAGATAILDATFMSDDDRAFAEATARCAGVPLTGLWLDCPPEELRRRIAGRTGDASDADLEVLESQLANNPGARDWLTVDAGGGIADTAASGRAALGLEGGDHGNDGA